MGGRVQRDGAARAAARAVVGVAGERAAAAAAARAATRAVGARVAARVAGAMVRVRLGGRQGGSEGGGGVVGGGDLFNGESFDRCVDSILHGFDGLRFALLRRGLPCGLLASFKLVRRIQKEREKVRWIAAKVGRRASMDEAKK